MPWLERPLANRVAGPLRTALVWGLIAAAPVLIIAAGAGGVAYLVSWVGEGGNPRASLWSWDVVQGIAALAAPVALASSSWSAAFASTLDQSNLRALIGFVAGGLALAGLGVLDWPTVVLGSAALAWSIAIPSDTWLRFSIRLLPALAATIALPLLLPEPEWWAATLIVGFSLPAAALLVGAGDWVGVRIRRG